MKSFAVELFSRYDDYTEKSILHRRFKHEDIRQILSRLKEKKIFGIVEAGKSFELREIYRIRIGGGWRNILLWSQMHGNEPTATLALLDIFNFLMKDDDLNEYRNEIIKNLSLNFIPMLNPDGAEYHQRRNAQDIDLNRDALSLAAPESVLLKLIRDEITAEFAFNLHDQELYYGVADTGKPSTIAFLAPAYNKEKEINESREKAMKIIVSMRKMLEKYIPGQIARYSDDFMPNAFGDNIQKWGTSTILIESGYYKDDLERQFVRKLNFVAILHALYCIATNSFQSENTEDYKSIPYNRRDSFFDILIKNVIIRRNGKIFKIDIGISRNKMNREEFTDYKEEYLIWDIGDLSSYFGHEVIDLQGEIIDDYNLKIRKFADASQLINRYLSK